MGALLKKVINCSALDLKWHDSNLYAQAIWIEVLYAQAIWTGELEKMETKSHSHWLGFVNREWTQKSIDK